MYKFFNTRIKIKRDTEITWEANNPVLLNGEIVLVDISGDKTKIKIGDGIKSFSQLGYFGSEYSKTEIDSLLLAVKQEAVSEAVATILGGKVDEKYDTLIEVANWILSDETSSAELVAKVNTIFEDYLSAADKSELENEINVNSDDILSIKNQLLMDSLILTDAINGNRYTIQIQNGQLVSFPVEE